MAYKKNSQSSKKKRKAPVEHSFTDYLVAFWGINLFYRLIVALAIVCLIVVVLYYVVISKYLDLSETALQSATKSCLLMVQANTEESFQVLDSEVQSDYSFITSKIVFHIRYANTSEAYIDCIFRKHIVGKKIQLKRINLVNEKGILRVRKNISIYINN